MVGICSHEIELSWSLGMMWLVKDRLDSPYSDMTLSVSGWTSKGSHKAKFAAHVTLQHLFNIYPLQ